MITVSSPCTPFSTAGRRDDPSDPRIQLTFNGLLMAVALSPAAIVLENVPSLLQWQPRLSVAVSDGVWSSAGHIGQLAMGCHSVL